MVYQIILTDFTKFLYFEAIILQEFSFFRLWFRQILSKFRWIAGSSHHKCPHSPGRLGFPGHVASGKLELEGYGANPAEYRIILAEYGTSPANFVPAVCASLVHLHEERGGPGQLHFLDECLYYSTCSSSRKVFLNFFWRLLNSIQKLNFSVKYMKRWKSNISRGLKRDSGRCWNGWDDTASRGSIPARCWFLY